MDEIKNLTPVNGNEKQTPAEIESKENERRKKTDRRKFACLSGKDRRDGQDRRDQNRRQ